MAVEFGLAESPEEVRAVQQLRYDVYVEELGRYRAAADHAERRFAEPEDDQSWLPYARDGTEIVATSRLTWGGAGFSPRQVEQYQLQPWLDELAPELLLVGERMAVRPSHRGTRVVDEMFDHTTEVVEGHGVRAAFGCCEPHLLSLYLALGQRPYAPRNINSDEAGYLIPLVAFTAGPDALRGASKQRGPDELPACVERALAGAGSVQSAVLVPPDEYWEGIRRTLDQLHERRVSAFDDLTGAEVERCLGHSNVIECSAGDRVLKRGGSARNMFVVLSGDLDVRDGDRLVGVLGAGDAFGEMAFLLEQQRTFDVIAATDARILSLSEGALRRMIRDDPAVAAPLLLNVAKMLCARLIRAEQPSTTA